MTPRTIEKLASLRRRQPHLPAARPTRARDVLRAARLLGALFCLAGVAQAQTTTAPTNPTQAGAPPPTSSAVTWHGITLYGIVDIGLQYDTHAAPFSD